jgi:hypothetical protein
MDAGIGEAERAAKITALGDFQQRGARLLTMIGAQAAVERTTAFDRRQEMGGKSGEFRPGPVSEGRQTAPDDRFEGAMLGADLP